tara:strand:+ start:7229 stop:8212 length:984 start_codon:yes stop_codon:yes gene_type:complete
MKTVFVQDHSHITGAGLWIYQGYKRAWESLGYKVVYIKGDASEVQGMSQLASNGEEYQIMLTDGFWAAVNRVCDQFGQKDKFDHAMNNAKNIFLFAQPTKFPPPWGSHPNFISLCDPEHMDEINGKNNYKLWTFADVHSGNVKDTFYPTWKDIATIPLAFDNFSYKNLKDEKYKFDVCFVGGRANNGFDEKYHIMMKHFSAFKDCGLKCGIFVNRGLSHEQENKILYNSKVAINIHDAYQRELGLDTNERTFKALGLTGVLVSDDIEQVKRLFPNVKTSNDPEQMVKFVKEYVNMPEGELEKIKEQNRKIILEKHTYTNRVKQMMGL